MLVCPWRDSNVAIRWSGGKKMSKQQRLRQQQRRLLELCHRWRRQKQHSIVSWHSLNVVLTLWMLTFVQQNTHWLCLANRLSRCRCCPKNMIRAIMRGWVATGYAFIRWKTHRKTRARITCTARARLCSSQRKNCNHRWSELAIIVIIIAVVVVDGR